MLMGQNLIFTNDVLAAITRLANGGDHNMTVWIADVNTARLVDPAPPRLIVIPDGDENKTLETVKHVWDEMERMGVTRRSLAINLGGGMVTDLGGWAAATFKRQRRNYLNSILRHPTLAGNEIGLCRGPQARHAQRPRRVPAPA